MSESSDTETTDTPSKPGDREESSSPTFGVPTGHAVHNGHMSHTCKGW